ncbi:MAG: hypothetical protein IJ571_00500 [Ruminococcus sp.]|nr:hypothetical protein [Ruminococcus sp.]
MKNEKFERDYFRRLVEQAGESQQSLCSKIGYLPHKFYYEFMSGKNFSTADIVLFFIELSRIINMAPQELWLFEFDYQVERSEFYNKLSSEEVKK